MRNRFLIPLLAAAAVLLVLAGAATALLLTTSGDDDDSTVATALGQQHPPDERAYLGITVAGGVLTGGVRVTSVDPASPAEAAGIRAGDIIRSIDGQLIRTNSDIQSKIESEKPGTPLTLTLERGDREIQVRVVLGTASAATFPTQPGPSGPLAPQRQLGVRVEQVTPALRTQYNLTRDSGVVIVDVLRGSPAMLAGLQPGDLLLTIQGRQIRTPDDVTTAVRSTSETALSVTYLRGSTETSTVVLLLPPDTSQIPGLDRLPGPLRDGLRRALEQGNLSPSDLAELQRFLPPAGSGMRFGAVKEVTSTYIVITPLEAGEDLHYAIDSRTELRRGITPIAPADLRIGESVLIISVDGTTAVGIISLGMQQLPPQLR